MDEIGLFYLLRHEHSLAKKQFKGKKKDKERLTIVICCNEDGSETISLWCIGKYAKPRCFKNVNMSSLNCQYHANKRARMTDILFQEYVRQLDRKMDGRKVLLLDDNCSAHPKHVEVLRNIELVFLPPSTTSNIQLCDAGIIRAFKMHYRRRFYRTLLEGYEIGISNPEKMNIVDAMNLAISAWTSDVHPSIIANYFRHCNLRSTTNINPENLSEELDSGGIHQVRAMLRELNYCNTMDVEYLLNYPEESEATSELLTDEQLIEKIMGNDKRDEVEDDSSILEPVSHNEAILATIALQNFLL